MYDNIKNSCGGTFQTIYFGKATNTMKTLSYT